MLLLEELLCTVASITSVATFTDNYESITNVELAPTTQSYTAVDLTNYCIKNRWSLGGLFPNGFCDNWWKRYFTNYSVTG